MKIKDYSILKAMCQSHGVTGDTEEVVLSTQKILSEMGIKSNIHGYGSLYFGNDKNPQKMVIAHIDEVGFQVVKIEDNGTLRLHPVGWVFPNRLDHALVYIRTDTERIPGVIVHEEVLKSENIERFDSLLIDIGAQSGSETTNMGIRVGQMGTFEKKFIESNNTFFATSIDNRVSQFAILALLARNKKILDDNLFIFNIDEETQDHNARGICKEYKPDLALVLDQAPVNQKRDHGDVMGELGKGSLVMYRGGSYILHPTVRRFFDTKIKSPFQKSFLSPQTLPSLEPAFYEENNHTVAVNVCIPTRGHHGDVYSVRKNDIENYVDLIEEILTQKFS